MNFVNCSTMQLFIAKLIEAEPEMQWWSQHLIFFFKLTLFSEKLVGMTGVGRKTGQFKGDIVNLMHIFKELGKKTPLY